MPSRESKGRPRLLDLQVRPLVLFCVLFVLIAVGWMSIRSINQETEALRAEVTLLRNERDLLSKQQNKLRNEVAILDTDDYIIAKARQLYGYMMPNELLFVIKNPEALYGDEQETVEMYVLENLD